MIFTKSRINIFKHQIEPLLKPYTYGITHAALDDVLHEYVGHEPSGQAFNKIILDNDGRPYNPMINMGAIMTCSLVHHQQPLSHRFNYFLENYKKLTGSRSTLSCNMPVYKSELEVGFMNKAAVNYMMTWVQLTNCTYMYVASKSLDF